MPNSLSGVPQLCPLPPACSREVRGNKKREIVKVPPAGEGNGTPLQYSCLENPMDGGAWQATVHGVAKSRTRLNDFTFTFTFMHWRRKWQPTLVFLPGESQGRGSLVGYSPWGRSEPGTTERLHFHISLSCIGGGHGNPLQCSCLENLMDGGAWWAAVYGVAQSRTRLKRFSSSSSSICLIRLSVRWL